jgi:hypothetical protein
VTKKDASRTSVESVVSEVPCCKCGGEVIEFVVENRIWNRIVRLDGPEHDKEYLCVACFAKQCVEFVESR